MGRAAVYPLARRARALRVRQPLLNFYPATGMTPSCPGSSRRRPVSSFRSGRPSLRHAGLPQSLTVAWSRSIAGAVPATPVEARAQLLVGRLRRSGARVSPEAAVSPTSTMTAAAPRRLRIVDLREWRRAALAPRQRRGELRLARRYADRRAARVQEPLGRFAAICGAGCPPPMARGAPYDERAPDRAPRGQYHHGALKLAGAG